MSCGGTRKQRDVRQAPGAQRVARLPNGSGRATQSHPDGTQRTHLAAPVVVVVVRAHLEESVVPAADSTQECVKSSSLKKSQSFRATTSASGPAQSRPPQGARRYPCRDAEGVAHLPQERRHLSPRRRLAVAVGAEEDAEKHLVRHHDSVPCGGCKGADRRERVATPCFHGRACGWRREEAAVGGTLFLFFGSVA